MIILLFVVGLVFMAMGLGAAVAEKIDDKFIEKIYKKVLTSQMTCDII